MEAQINQVRLSERKPCGLESAWARTSCSLSSMFRSALSASTTKPLVSLTDPLTRRNCNAIRDALHSAYPLSEERPDPSETHAAVLVPLCNVDGRPGVLLEVRGKLRTHSGEVRYVFFMVAARRRQPDASYIVADSFPGGKVDKVRTSFPTAVHSGIAPAARP